MAFDYSDILKTIKEKSPKTKINKNRTSIALGSGLGEVSRDPNDYVVMPDWWEESYGVLGLPFGNIVQIAGTPDSGKTSACIVAMKAAQEQGYGIVYVETEQKTTVSDIEEWGVDPDQMIMIKQPICEYAWDDAMDAIDGFFAQNPDSKLLFLFDSYGNTISLRDAELRLATGSQKPGGAAKVNRMGINKLILKMLEHDIAPLIINYTYDNIGSKGKTNAGGQGLNFFSKITVQSSRKGWYEGQRSGEKVRLGAVVCWKMYKNHFAKGLTTEDGDAVFLPKEIDLRITANGMERIR